MRLKFIIESTAIRSFGCGRRCPHSFPTDRRLSTNRKLIAGLFALAILPATSFTADAGVFDRTRALSCQIGSDGESLQIRMIVKNTSDRTIAKGTPIRLDIRTRYYSYTKMSEAYRDVPPNRTIPLSAPSKGASHCSVSVSFGSIAHEKVKKFPRVGTPR
jgi:hypothetical protein